MNDRSMPAKPLVVGLRVRDHSYTTVSHILMAVYPHGCRRRLKRDSLCILIIGCSEPEI